MNMRSSSWPFINKCHLVAVYCAGVELSLCGLVAYKEILKMHLCVSVGRFHINPGKHMCVIELKCQIQQRGKEIGLDHV